MVRIPGRTLKALGYEIRLATLWLKLDVVIAGLERRYRPDQPRAPKGSPEGGQWIDDLSIVGAAKPADERVHVAGPRCSGGPGGCQMGGTFGTTGGVRVSGRDFCWDCAIKILGINGLPYEEQVEVISGFDSSWKKGGTSVGKN